METIHPAHLRRDGGTQMRAELNEDALTEYVALWQAGETAPPVVAFYDGAAYWLADGFHRAESAGRAGIESIACDVRAGTRRDAILYAVGANARHGLRRTNADKRRAVETLLNDPEWAAWSNREIARRAAVADSMVGDMRKVICSPTADASPAARTVERNGTTYQQNTANIGRKTPPAAPAPVRVEPSVGASSGFVADTVAKTGLTESEVEIYLFAGENLTEAAKTEIRGTPLEDDLQSLVSIAALRPELQTAVAHTIAGLVRTERTP